VLRFTAGLGEHSEHILQRLLELRNYVFAVKHLLLIPADLSGHKDDTARRNNDAVGISDRRRPSRRVQSLKRHDGLKCLRFAR